MDKRIETLEEFGDRIMELKDTLRSVTEGIRTPWKNKLIVKMDNELFTMKDAIIEMRHSGKHAEEIPQFFN